jgi:hypothetical protein
VLEAELRRLPRVASPLLLTVASADFVVAIPYIANKALGYHWLGTSEGTLNTWAAALVGWTLVVAVVLMVRGRRWAWLAAVLALFIVIALLDNSPASYVLEAPLALCIGLFALTGRRFALLFAARRLRLRGQEA